MLNDIMSICSLIFNYLTLGFLVVLFCFLILPEAGVKLTDLLLVGSSYLAFLNIGTKLAALIYWNLLGRPSFIQN